MPLGQCIRRRTNESLKMGLYCSIGSDLKIISNSKNHPDSKCIMVYNLSLNELLNLKKQFNHIQVDHIQDPVTKVQIGNNVWIGDNVTLQAGITIGDGVYIESNSIVLHSIDPYSYVESETNLKITPRFSKDHIEELSKIQWSDEKYIIENWNILHKKIE
jgi:virginiamycin A acetyltransferase